MKEKGKYQKRSKLSAEVLCFCNPEKYVLENHQGILVAVEKQEVQ